MGNEDNANLNDDSTKQNQATETEGEGSGSEETQGKETQDQGTEGTEPIRPKWADQLPEEYRDHEAFQVFKKLGDLAKAYLDGTEELKSLKEETGEVTIPEKAEDYEFGKPENVPEDYEVEIDEEMVKEFREKMFELKIPKEIAEEIYNWYGQYFLKTVEADEKAIEKELDKYTEQLQKDWGDDYKVNLDLAQRVSARFVTEELADLLDETGLLYHPAMIKAAYELGKVLSEDTLEGGKPVGGGETKSKSPDQTTDVPEGQEATALDKIYPSTKGVKGIVPSAEESSEDLDKLYPSTKHLKH